MNEFRRRVKRLEELLKVRKPSVTLVYNDGRERLVGSLEAVSAIVNDHSIVDIKCDGETGRSLFSVMLEAEQEYGNNFDDLEEVE